MNGKPMLLRKNGVFLFLDKGMKDFYQLSLMKKQEILLQQIQQLLI